MQRDVDAIADGHMDRYTLDAFGKTGLRAQGQLSDWQNDFCTGCTKSRKDITSPIAKVIHLLGGLDHLSVNDFQLFQDLMSVRIR